jgi:(p)ppGpp synthase/HD superfamily hydrolase
LAPRDIAVSDGREPHQSLTNLVIAALLHDTVEDVGVTKDELTQAFGADVAELVVELTDDKALPKAGRVLI